MECELSEKMNALEAESVWRLKDCQEFMKTRVSEEFVDTKLKRYYELQQTAVIYRTCFT